MRLPWVLRGIWVRSWSGLARRGIRKLFQKWDKAAEGGFYAKTGPYLLFAASKSVVPVRSISLVNGSPAKK